MIRLKFFPPYEGDNEYIELFYGALEPHGVHATDDLNPWDRSLLAEQAPSLDAIHVQWCPEWIWRGYEPGGPRHLRRLLRFWRYLRLARRLGVRVLWTVHDLRHHEGDAFVDVLGYRLLARYSDLCICHSEATRREVIRRFGADPGRVVVMEHGNYDGVLPSPRPAAETRSGLGLPGGRRALLCFGRVRPYKGFDLALEAARELGDEYHLIIAGKPLEASYGESIRSSASGLPNVTAILEEVDNQRLADLIEAVDCVVLPYRQITGSGVLFTSLTQGRGVVASDLPFFSEVLAADPAAGELFRPGDARDLARAIRSFFDRPAGDRHAAARRIADDYSWDRTILPVAGWFARTFPGGVGRALAAGRDAN